MAYAAWGAVACTPSHTQLPPSTPSIPRGAPPPSLPRGATYHPSRGGPPSFPWVPPHTPSRVRAPPPPTPPRPRVHPKHRILPPDAPLYPTLPPRPHHTPFRPRRPPDPAPSLPSRTPPCRPNPSHAPGSSSSGHRPPLGPQEQVQPRPRPSLAAPPPAHPSGPAPRPASRARGPAEGHALRSREVALDPSASTPRFLRLRAPPPHLPGMESAGRARDRVPRWARGGRGASRPAWGAGSGMGTWGCGVRVAVGCEWVWGRGPPLRSGSGPRRARGLVPAGTLGRATGRTCARNFIWGLQVVFIHGL